MCIMSVCALLKVVGYYDLSTLSMSVMGFHKKNWMEGGWGELYPIFFGIFGICLTLQSPLFSSWIKGCGKDPEEGYRDNGCMM